MTIAYPCRTLAAALLLTLTSPVWADATSNANLDEEPLAPEVAFVGSAKIVDGNTLRAEWAVADGYYLYREKFKFRSDTAGIGLGEPRFPQGKIKQDDTFGKVETYRKHVAIDIPLNRTGADKVLDLTMVSQGCADIGLCYPPQTHVLKVNLPPAASAQSTPTVTPAPTSSTSPLAALKKLGNTLGLADNQPEFLPADEVFVFSARAQDGNTVIAHWDIHEGYYLYRDKFSFELQDAQGVTLAPITLPAGETKTDPNFGEMVTYHRGVDITLPLLRTQLAPTEINLVAKYQGCAEAGFCYPPITKTTPLSLPSGQTQIATDTGATTQPASEQDRIAATLSGGGTWLTLISFFGFGLLLSFTPCVFPMIPILSSIIVGQGEGLSTRRAFTMSLVYVLAMAVTYTVAGVIAGLFGENVQAAFQNPWILGSFSAVFVALSLSMFGFYELQMPNFLQSKLTEFSNRQRGGTLVGVGVMGFLSALIVGPCVAAPLMGALIYIGQTGDAVLGGSALFALSLGMGAPLLAIGTSAGKLLPKAGDWMNTIKAVFGVMLLAVAIWMLERIVPTSVIMALWATLLITSGVYLGALEPYGRDATGWRKLWKGVGLISVVYGTLLLIGVAAGGKDILQPLYGVSSAGGATGATAGTSHELPFKKIKGPDGLERALTEAKGKPVMLDFYADWCISCKEMEKYTFADAGVQQALSGFVLLQADVTANDEQDKALLKRFKLVGPPSMIFFDRDGAELRASRLVGFLKPEAFTAHVARVAQ